MISASCTKLAFSWLLVCTILAQLPQVAPKSEIYLPVRNLATAAIANVSKRSSSSGVVQSRIPCQAECPQVLVGCDLPCICTYAFEGLLCLNPAQEAEDLVVIRGRTS